MPINLNDLRSAVRGASPASQAPVESASSETHDSRGCLGAGILVGALCLLFVFRSFWIATVYWICVGIFSVAWILASLSAVLGLIKIIFDGRPGDAIVWFLLFGILGAICLTLARDGLPYLFNMPPAVWLPVPAK